MRWPGKMRTRKQRYEEISALMSEHLAEKTDEFMAGGMSRVQAEQAAKREFGNVALIEQRSREVWQWPTAESVLFDVRFGVRQLIRSPGFTFTAVFTLALGIAVNATMFSLVSAFLLPRLPGHDAQSLVVVTSVNPDDATFQADTNPVSAPNYLAWKKDSRVFSAMAAGDEYRAGSLSGPGQQPEAVSYAAVTPNYFSVFGVAPQLGRSFLSGEDQPAHDHVLILSHGLWERRYGSDPSVIGRTVRLNREDYTVAGVMAADFRLTGFIPQLWIPLALTAKDGAPDARKDRSLYLFARLAPGVTLEQARAGMSVAAQEAQHDFPAMENRWGAAVRTLEDFLVHNFGIRSALAIIMTVVGFVLLIACANVAGLLLTRSVGRQKELAIRMSLGARRARIVRQLLTEGLMIALPGGCVGLFLTCSGIRLLRAGLNFNEAMSAVPVSLDKNVLIFAAAVSLLCAVLSSLLPALKASRSEVSSELKNDSRGASPGRSHNRLRLVLVAGEIAIALFLLIGSGTLIRGAYLLDHQELGFSHDHLLTAGILLDQARYADASKQIRFVRALRPQLEQIPGVQEAAIVSDLPASGSSRTTIHIKGRPESRSNDQLMANDVMVTPGSLHVAGVPLLRGRAFTEADDAAAPRVVLVNQEFVHRYFQDQDPVGRQIKLDAPDAAPAWSTIIGVAADIKSFSEDPRVDPEVYEAFLQRPVSSFSLMLRSNVDPDTLAPEVRAAVARLDAELPLLRVMSMDEVIDSHRNGNPLFEGLLATFGFLAILLAAIGIYGLIAYSVGQRTHEIGIRMALGARASDISRMILQDGLKVAAAGSAIGFVTALPLPKIFNSIFPGVQFGAPGVYPVVLGFMLIVALGATLVPARRASRIDPTAALRSE